MKTLKNYMMMLLACVFAVACTNNDYQTVIPKDAQFVASFNFKSFFEDVEIPEESMNNIKSLMGMAFSGKDRDKIDEFLEGNTSFGIDFSEPIYAFSSPDCPFGISIKVNSEDDMDKLFELLNRQNMCKKTKEKDGYKWSTLLEDFTIAYNDNVLLICGDMPENKMKKLFDTDEDNSFIATSNFAKMDKKDSPFLLFSNLSAIEEADESGSLKTLLPEGVRFSDTNLITELLMGKGKAEVNAEIFSAKENIQALLEDADKNFKKINGDFIKAPENFLMWCGMGLKGEDLLKKLKANDEINGMIMMMDRAIDIQKIIKAIDGDFAFVIPEISTNNGTEMVLTAKVKDTDFLKDVNYWQEQMKDWNIKMVENDKNDYTLFLDEENGIKWGVDDKIVYFSSQSSSYKKTFAETNPLLDEQVADIKNSIFYLCLNLNPLVDNLKSLFLSQMDDQMSAMVDKIDYPFDKIVIKANNARSFSFSISLKDKNKNVINALFELSSQIQEMAMGAR